MRPRSPRYPVDRYLVESSNKLEIFNVIDEDIWNPEPALRPEDEMILRRLHEMLQSTADDLKLLSGELPKCHQPGVQYMTAATPLDEDFNEKVHIEEIVNAKFHGYKIIDNPRVPDVKTNMTDIVKPVNIKPKVKSSGFQANSVPGIKKLTLSKTRVLQINENHNGIYHGNNQKLNNAKNINKGSKVAYNEFSYKYVEPKIKDSNKPLQVQKMPSIDIRSELKEQKVLQLDILPENVDRKGNDDKNRNIIFVSVKHGNNTNQVLQSKSKSEAVVRKISKMETCESSSGSNNISSEVSTKVTERNFISPFLNLPRTRVGKKERLTKEKKDNEKGQRLNLEERKKKINDVASTSRKINTNFKVNINTLKNTSKSVPKNNNNADYIPYSKLTLGGVRVSDIEREISDIENKIDVPLTPILNKILNSRENSFIKESPENLIKNGQNIFTQSDENLIQEIIDIEKTVSETLSKKYEPDSKVPMVDNVSSLGESEKASYDDDFEDDNSEKSGKQVQLNENVEESPDNNVMEEANKLPPHTVFKDNNDSPINASNLAVKKTIDIFEFIHEIDTQDIAIQSTSSKITPKETQTSPRYEKQSIEPIHNDLWPSIDPRREIEKMFTLEKDFIKNLIIEEYGEVLEKSLNKPLSSTEEDKSKNIATFQKNTQTSPARVKSVMTSPARTKTRTTSPFIQPISVTDHQTSPTIVIKRPEARLDDDLAISINLSSPRFSLRLPQNSRDVLSNLESSTASSKISLNSRKQRSSMRPPLSSSSIDADNSSSELSSLGEVKLKLRKLTRRVSSISEFSDTSSNYNSDCQTTSLLPLKSEGELSLGRIHKTANKRNVRSEGETSAV